jgi:drug/metabolite transporter (DMT)-like permease
LTDATDAASSTAKTRHAIGVPLALAGGLALTFDVPLIRLGDGTIWSVMLLRSACVFVSGIAVWFLWRQITGTRMAMVPGRWGVLVGALYALSSISFLAAVQMTPTANLVFILALNPMVTALMSWAFLKERPHPVTFAAIAIMLAAVLFIVEEGLEAGHGTGDALAFVATFTIAAAIVVNRASGRDMGFMAVIAAGLILPVAGFVVAATGYHVANPGWIVIDGLFVISLSFFCLGLAPRYLPGAEVAMFYLLETIITPVWVWLIFSEAPSRQTLVAGSVMVVTLLAHSVWQLASGRRRRAAHAVRHPG